MFKKLHPWMVDSVMGLCCEYSNLLVRLLFAHFTNANLVLHCDWWLWDQASFRTTFIDTDGDAHMVLPLAHIVNHLWRTSPWGFFYSPCGWCHHCALQLGAGSADGGCGPRVPMAALTANPQKVCNWAGGYSVSGERPGPKAGAPPARKVHCHYRLPEART